MKKVFAILLALVMLLSFAACKSETAPETTGAKLETKAITVLVTHANGETKTFTYETTEEILGRLLLNAGLIQGNEGQYGLEIHTVDGEKAVYTEDKAYWAVYIGEEYALTGVDGISITDGGVYKLVYTNA